MKVVVYTGTRNLYRYMLIAATSLLKHTQVDKIYFLIEDDQFPYLLPEIIECINVSNQSYIKLSSPNYHTHWSYMTLLKVASTKMFPHLDKIVTLDTDTIVQEDISPLWDYDLTNYYFAAVRDPEAYKDLLPLYVNCGVVIFNLKLMRQHHIDDQLIQAVNHKKYHIVDQDALNEVCYGHILELPSEYNVSPATTPYEKPAIQRIIHFCTIPFEQWTQDPLVQ